MRNTVVDINRTGFLLLKSAELACVSPLPTRLEQNLNYTTRMSGVNMEIGQFVEHTAQMEATLKSNTDPSKMRHVILSDQLKTPPSFCADPTLGEIYPCFQRREVI